MKRTSETRLITIGGLLTTISIILQTAPIYLPTLGLAISPFSTLPIAIAGVYSIPMAIYVFFSTSLLLIFINIQEALIYIFATGLIGLIIGTLIYRKGIILSIIISSIMLTIGISFLTFIIEISGFKEIIMDISIPIIIIIYLFALVYTTLWNIPLRKIKNKLFSFKTQ